MEENRLQCTLLTPMFSYGAYQGKCPEIRASELKGMMRYVYRIIRPVCKETLVKEEADLFGGAADERDPGKGHASPVRLLIQNNCVINDTKQLLLHKEKIKTGPKMKCLNKGSFEVVIRLNPNICRVIQKRFPAIQLKWYTELAELTFMLCGLGKRSRKGRGSIAVKQLSFADKKEALQWICEKLNVINEISSNQEKFIYKLEKDVIQPTCRMDNLDRPVIQKIYVGIKLEQPQIESFLEAVDQISHDIKGGKNITKEQKMATGFVEISKNKSIRFASPLIISLIRTQAGYYPLYVFVKAVCEKKQIDCRLKYRERFIEMAEGRVRK